MVLKFRVKGSAREPYQITVDGEGDSFRAFCTCPAGRKGGKFCKHIAALLVGDVTNLVDGIDQMDELARMSSTSRLVLTAVQHNPSSSSPGIQGFESLDDVLDRLGRDLADLGWHIEQEKFPDSAAIHLHRRLKSGAPQKTPFISLSFEKFAWDEVVQEDGTLARANRRLRTRPWILRGRQLKANTWATLARALPDFLSAAGIKP